MSFNIQCSLIDNQNITKAFRVYSDDGVEFGSEQLLRRFRETLVTKEGTVLQAYGNSVGCIFLTPAEASSFKQWYKEGSNLGWIKVVLRDEDLKSTDGLTLR